MADLMTAKNPLKTRVGIARGEEAYETTARLLDRRNFRVTGKVVLLKPNLTTLSSAESGITTDVGVCRAILERLDGCRILIGEGSGGANTWTAFEQNGYVDLARRFDAKLVNFDEVQVVRKPIPAPLHFTELPFARTVFDVDYLISAAKLKIHSLAQVTLSLKNMFGCVPRSEKLRVHPHINRGILDIAQVIYPDFAVIDGIVGNERDEVDSFPVPSDIVLAGEDALSVDQIGCRCMGVDPEEVEHLRRGTEFFGPRAIELLGPSLSEVARTYNRKRSRRGQWALWGSRVLGWVRR
ncbi:MAG: hypothetical protein DRP97_07565 [Candidatus Latescibacterota bacterium]|nr:MAG: hypothetical protein B1H02_05700 [Candidatus Latescibacteria bacterium 4484_107]RKY67253.1 MAG: hypothetical protein DRP97_07565 [Candidatus Latescibacterota bacterium]